MNMCVYCKGVRVSVNETEKLVQAKIPGIERITGATMVITRCTNSLNERESSRDD